MVRQELAADDPGVLLGPAVADLDSARPPDSGVLSGRQTDDGADCQRALTQDADPARAAVQHHEHPLTACHVGRRPVVEFGE
jgi:hypothetical protein